MLSRSSVGEASVFVILLSPELGLLRALVQGVRKSGAKLAHALTTLAESDVVLVRGKDGWRVAGAVPAEDWFLRLRTGEARARAGRVVSLLLRLVAGEEREQELFPVLKEFFEALAELPDNFHEAAEILAALRILAALGLDSGETAGGGISSRERLGEILKNRTAYIARINEGITASGL